MLDQKVRQAKDRWQVTINKGLQAKDRGRQAKKRDVSTKEKGWAAFSTKDKGSQAKKKGRNSPNLPWFNSISLPEFDFVVKKAAFLRLFLAWKGVRLPARPLFLAWNVPYSWLDRSQGGSHPLFLAWTMQRATLTFGFFSSVLDIWEVWLAVFFWIFRGWPCSLDKSSPNFLVF